MKFNTTNPNPAVASTTVDENGVAGTEVKTRLLPAQPPALRPVNAEAAVRQQPLPAANIYDSLKRTRKMLPVGSGGKPGNPGNPGNPELGPVSGGSVERLGAIPKISNGAIPPSPTPSTSRFEITSVYTVYSQLKL